MGLSCPAYAMDGPLNRLQSPAAKKYTEQAIRAMEQGRWDEARDMTARSKDPLASKIYYWWYFQEAKSESWDTAFFQRVRHFVQNNPDWPKIGTLIRRAEKNMPEDLPSRDVLSWFEAYPPKTPGGMARYLDAMLIEGKHKDVQAHLKDWWAGILVSRDLQKEIFRKYGQYLTLDAHKRRFDVLLLSGHYANARAIAGVLGQGYPELAEARIALAEKKSGVTVKINKVPRYLQSNPGLLYERLKWRRQHDEDLGAMEILHSPPDPAKVSNPKDWWLERHIIIRRLLEKKQCGNAYLLAEKHIQKEGFAYAQAEWITGWLALRCMNKPTEAYERFIALYHKVKMPISKARAAYWLARAAEDMKQAELAKSWYKKAATYQTVYYGQLARQKLALAERLPKAAVPSLSSYDLATYNKNELIQTAQLLDAAGLRTLAGNFIQAFVKSEKSPKAYRYGAELAARMGHYHDAVRIAKEATKKGLFLTAQAFPTLDKVSANNGQVEWALVHALVRQESMFDFEAKSPAGARGLMQLMPSTAKETAGKQNISYQKTWLTQRPDYNVRLGTAYLRQLLDRYDDSYPLAVAAYNAGPGRVNQWIKNFGDPRKGEVSVLDWIEMIPVYETRNYVQRVMENLYVYRIILKEKNKGRKLRKNSGVNVVNKRNP